MPKSLEEIVDAKQGAAIRAAPDRRNTPQFWLERFYNDPAFLASVFGGGGAGSGGSAASRASALRQLDIQKKRLLFQQKTGLRDIKQGLEKGLRGAINNALQRGIFRSGITQFNKNEVTRESGEAAGDLKTNIGFSLEAIRESRTGINAQPSGGGGGGGLSGIDSGVLENVAKNFASDFIDPRKGNEKISFTPVTTASQRPPVREQARTRFSRGGL